MIRRFDFGHPLHTGATVLALESEKDISTLPRLHVTRDGESVTFTCPLQADTRLYGLGETVRGINKRGHHYRSWNTDDFIHTEEKESLYSSHNFLIVASEADCFGFFLDDPGEVIWHLGDQKMNEMTVTSVCGDLSLYLIEEETPAAICRELRRLTGKSYLPPYWAFGYIQSRWGYAGDADMREVLEGHRTRDIPLDGICLDIDYMDRFRDFTWDSEKIPDLKALTHRLREENIHLIPIIDAGIPVAEDDPTSDDGVKEDVFVKTADGSLFQAAVWPGLSYFTDFLSPKGRAWFGDRYREMLTCGVDGFWNDMNEPALFYSREGMQKAYAVFDELRGKNLDLDGNWALSQAANSLANSMDDYTAFYHEVDGRKVRHDRVHNLYGFGMMRASREGMDRFAPGQRFLLFARSSYIGAHRYGGIWQGDNRSWWSHLKLNMQMLASLNMCGFLFNGADIGGFGSDTSPDLLLRWLELGIFTPLMRNHSSLHTRDQEIFRFECWEDMRAILTLRYALIPYLYSEFMKAAHDDGLLFRPLAFDYPHDPIALQTEDQLMLGGECMIAPVVEPNSQGRYVYLPEDMLLLRMRSSEDMEEEKLEKGVHFVPCRLNEALLFVRRGHAVPFVANTKGVRSTVDLRGRELTLHGWDAKAPYTLYTDDGISMQEGTCSLLGGEA